NPVVIFGLAGASFEGRVQNIEPGLGEEPAVGGGIVAAPCHGSPRPIRLLPMLDTRCPESRQKRPLLPEKPPDPAEQVAMLGSGDMKDRIERDDGIEASLRQSDTRKVAFDVGGGSDIGPGKRDMLPRKVDTGYLGAVVSQILVDRQPRSAAKVQDFVGGR